MTPPTLHIIEPENYPADAPPGHLLVHLGDPEIYARHHIEGAIYVHPSETQSRGNTGPGKLPEVDRLNQLLGRIGLTEQRHVVVYDDEGGGWAGRFIWLLDSVGHHRYSYLDGGLAAWHQAGLPLSHDPVTPVPATVNVQIHTHPTATREQVLTALERADVAIWDARSPAEYAGTRALAARAGHIPGAINVEWTEGMNPQQGLRIRQDEAFRQRLMSAGVTPDKEIITYCQTHHRSGFTYLLARALGYTRVRGYAGSWFEWGNDPETPIESSLQETG